MLRQRKTHTNKSSSHSTNRQVTPQIEKYQKKRKPWPWNIHTLTRRVSGVTGMTVSPTCIETSLLLCMVAMLFALFVCRMVITNEPLDPVDPSCTFCPKLSDKRYYHFTWDILNALQARPECMDIHNQNITIVTKKQNVAFPDVLSNIFRGKVVAHVENDASCTTHDDGDDMMDTEDLLTKWSHFVRNQLNLTANSSINNQDFSIHSSSAHIDDKIEDEDDDDEALRVVLVERTAKSRQFRNATKLKRVLELESKPNQRFNVELYDFNGMSLRQQIEALTVPPPAFIVMAHGAAETNLLYLDTLTASKTNIIELCPPYTHCPCTDYLGTQFCPSLFEEQTRFLNLSFFSYGTEDKQLDCVQYCSSNEASGIPGGKARQRVRGMKYITVTAHSLLHMMRGILEQQSVDNGKDVNRMWRYEMDFGESVRWQFANLNAWSVWFWEHIQPSDMEGLEHVNFKEQSDLD